MSDAAGVDALLPPGATIGIVGGGQLGRMLALAAGSLGYRTIVLEPQADCPAAQFSNRQIVAPYDDATALDALAGASDVITYEFENVPLEAAHRLAGRVPLYPPAKALEVAQDRAVEKRFLEGLGTAVAPWRPVEDAGELGQALAAFGGGVLKTRRFGYDGKGQHVFRAATTEGLDAILAATGAGPWVLERMIAFDHEFSVIVARGGDGGCVAYDPSANRHEAGILRTSTVPCGLDDDTIAAALATATKIADALDYRGVLAVEFFATAAGPLVNEIAPRVHNSGHWTVEACAVGQFEQHIRAVAGLPLGDGSRLSDARMDNLIGEEIADVPRHLAAGGLVTLYGKAQARAGRKMGHVTTLIR